MAAEHEEGTFFVVGAEAKQGNGFSVEQMLETARGMMGDEKYQQYFGGVSNSVETVRTLADKVNHIIGLQVGTDNETKRLRVRMGFPTGFTLSESSFSKEIKLGTFSSKTTVKGRIEIT